MEQARRLIAENLRTKNPYLDLGNCGLTDLRELPELFECTHLEELVLSNFWYELENETWVTKVSQNQGVNNEISFLAPLFYRLSSLKKIILSSNQISDIVILKELKQLRSLDLSSNEIIDIAVLEELKQLTFLNLSSNQISDIAVLKELKQLTSLYLSSNQISDIVILKELKQLRSLDLSFNQISGIIVLKELKQLRSLDLSLNPISDIIVLKELKQLTFLNLSSNPISDITVLKELKQLTSLYLSSNPISDITVLKELKQLRSLDLSSNQINDITFLKELKQLRSLDLNYNPISDIFVLKELKELTSLELSSNEISDITVLKELKQLTRLSLISNQISDITVLKELKQLTSLVLRSNQIIDIAVLKELKQLTSLVLSSNENSDIAVLKELKQLTFLNLRNNSFLDKAGLVLKEFGNHLETIQNYFLRQDEIEKFEVILPAKVLLLGNHGVGKSTLLHFLQHENLDIETESTHIINIETYTKNKVGLPDAIFYDFGGQDYYHGIYRAFLSSGSIYSLLWNPTTNKNKNRTDSNEITTRDMTLSYWLGQKNYIESKKYDFENDPLLLIQTYADKNPRMAIGNVHGINNEFYVSLDKNSNNKLNQSALQYLKATLIDLIEQKQITRNEPQWYIAFLVYILDTKGKGHKSETIQSIYDKHYKRNKDNNVETFAFFKDDLEQLHRQGLILYYKDELPEIAWLNPKALVQYVHDKILSKKIITEKKGIVPLKELEKFDKNIIELLKLQKVIFLHEFGENGYEYIIPNYLPLTEETGFDYDLFTFGLDNPAFTLYFERFVPMGLINQMICHFGRLPDKKKFWRDQLLFTFEKKAKVLINVDMINLEIKVYTSFVKNVQEYEKEKIHKYLFYCILSMYSDAFVLDYESYFNFISDKLKTNEINNNKFREQSLLYEFLNFYILDDLYVSLNNQHFINYRRLNEIENERVIQSYIKENDKFVLYKDIPIYDFKIFTNKKLNKMKKVFISYSHDDLEYRKELQKFLINLERDNEIEIWQDGLINPGDEWDKTIQESLENADIVILLVSQSFIASTYSHYVEMRKAMQKHGDGSAKIIPVLIKTCDWKNWKVIPEDLDLSDENLKAKKYEMRNYQFMPMNDDEQRIRPVNKWDYQEDAWQKVVDYIRNKCL